MLLLEQSNELANDIDQHTGEVILTAGTKIQYSDDQNKTPMIS